MTTAYPVTNRNRLRRRHERGHYDHATVHAILDAAMICHIAYVIDGQPFCTPTSFWREGERLYLAWLIRQPHDARAGRRAAGLPDRHAPRRGGCGALGLSSLGELPLRDGLRPGAGGDRPSGQAAGGGRLHRSLLPGPRRGAAAAHGTGGQGDHHPRDGDRRCRGEDPLHRRRRRGGGLRDAGLVRRAAVANGCRRAGGMPASVAGRHARHQRNDRVRAGAPISTR